MIRKSLCCLLSVVALSASAQNTARELLKKKTEQKIHQIIKGSAAITGLMAVDLTSGDTISFNPDLVFPQASAIKIPILMEVYKQAGEGKFSLSDKREISPASVVGGTGIIEDLSGPVAISIQNMCVLMIALSDNTATNSLIDLVGMPHVNATLTSLGLEHTRLQRTMINVEASGRGEENIATPAEAVEILRMLYHGEFIDKSTSEQIISILQTPAREESRLAAGIPGSVPIAFKPGVLNGVSTEWALVLLAERPYAVAVMESYKVKRQAEKAVERISKVLYHYFWRMGNATRYGTYVDPAIIR